VTRAWIAIVSFSRGEDGASLPEYALLLALVTVVCIAAISILGTKVSSFLNAASTSI